MFIHRNRGRNAQAVSLGLLAAALISTVVSAADPPDAFVLVAYSNRAGGTQIANGEYLSATQVTRAGVPQDRGALATNHCVAFAMSEQLGKAQLACDSAVQAAFSEQAELPSWNARSRAQAANSQAVAYSNRAVLRWLNADAQGARAGPRQSPGAGATGDFRHPQHECNAVTRECSPRPDREPGEGGTGMTGVGDGASLSIPLERMPRLLCDRRREAAGPGTGPRMNDRGGRSDITFDPPRARGQSPAPGHRMKPQAPHGLPRTNDRSGSRGIAFDPPRGFGPSPAPVHPSRARLLRA